MFLQALAVRVGLATGRDLAQCCRDSYSSTYLLATLWIVNELAIAATDLAEVLGSAIALNLLFGIPILAGVFITTIDVLIILLTQGRSFRIVEIFVGTLILIITVCFAIQIGISNPDPVSLLLGYLPSPELVSNGSILFVAIGIIGKHLRHLLPTLEVTVVVQERR